MGKLFERDGILVDSVVMSEALCVLNLKRLASERITGNQEGGSDSKLSKA